MMHVVADQHVDGPPRPLAGVNERMSLSDTPRRSQQQREREVSGGVGQHIGSIRHQDSMPRRSGNVDIVKPNSDIGNHAHAFQLVEHVGCKSIDKLADDGLLLRERLNQFIGGEPVGCGNVIDVSVLLEKFDGFGIDAFGDQNRRHIVIALHRRAVSKAATLASRIVGDLDRRPCADRGCRLMASMVLKVSRTDSPCRVGDREIRRNPLQIGACRKRKP